MFDDEDVENARRVRVRNDDDASDEDGRLLEE